MNETFTLFALDAKVEKSVGKRNRSASNVPLERTVARVEDQKRLGLTLVRLIPPFKSETGRWNYRGDYQCNLCGRVINLERDFAKRKQTCGCYDTHTKHGHARGNKRSKLYRVWMGMKQRCLNPNGPSYHCYGGRGITVCAEWMEFAPFAEWALPAGYRDGVEIDRIDVHQGYSPENCRWVTPQINVHNRRVTKLSYEITHAIKVLSAAGMSPSSIARVTKVQIDNIPRILRGDIWMENPNTEARLKDLLERIHASNRTVTRL